MTSEAYGALAAWGDYDNDGRLELYVGTIQTDRRGRLFRSVGDGDFVEINSVVPAQETGNFRPVWVDYDNDGDLDLFAAAFNQNINRLYQNNGNTNHWLKVRLKGTQSNSHGVGARVFATAAIGGQTVRQMRQITAQASIQELEAHFGLGDATNVETLRIEWPSGHVTEIHEVASKQILNITEQPELKCLGWEGTNMCLAITGNIGERYEVLTCDEFVEPAIPPITFFGTTAVPATNSNKWVLWRTVTNTARRMTVTDPSPIAPQRFYKAVPAK
jgi:hypothetical protein